MKIENNILVTREIYTQWYKEPFTKRKFKKCWVLILCAGLAFISLYFYLDEMYKDFFDAYRIYDCPLILQKVFLFIHQARAVVSDVVGKIPIIGDISRLAFFEWIGGVGGLIFFGIWYAICQYIIHLTFGSRTIMAAYEYQKLLEKFGCEEWNRRVCFDDIIKIWDNAVFSSYTYEEITEIMETRTYFYLIIGKYKDCIFLKKTCFNMHSLMFRNFICIKCQEASFCKIGKFTAFDSEEEEEE